MKYFLLPLAVAGLLVNTQFAVAQAQKATKTVAKKKVSKK